MVLTALTMSPIPGMASGDEIPGTRSGALANQKNATQSPLPASKKKCWPIPAGSSIVYYAVASAREAQAQLAEGGTAFEEDARCIARVGDRDIWLAVCRDSEGNLIGLMSEE